MSNPPGVTPLTHLPPANLSTQQVLEYLAALERMVQITHSYITLRKHRSGFNANDALQGLLANFTNYQEVLTNCPPHCLDAKTITPNPPPTVHP